METVLTLYNRKKVNSITIMLQNLQMIVNKAGSLEFGILCSEILRFEILHFVQNDKKVKVLNDNKI